jgi:hypothetical protein
MENTEKSTEQGPFEGAIGSEDIIARLSRESHGGQQISFEKYEHCGDMIAVENPNSGRIEFGVSPGEGVDVFVYSHDSDDVCAAMTITTGSWDHVCAHLIETDLHPEWSFARQISFGSSSTTMHKPRGLIVSQFSGRRGLMGLRIKLAQKMRRAIYTEVELTDGSTAWERWYW